MRLTLLILGTLLVLLVASTLPSLFDDGERVTIIRTGVFQP